LVAVTVKVYAVPLTRPVTVSEVAVVVAVIPPGDEITVYPVMELPPSETGAVHKTVAWRSPGVADTSVGWGGTSDTVTVFCPTSDMFSASVTVTTTI
jgi:hypothetical protein